MSSIPEYHSPLAKMSKEIRFEALVEHWFGLQDARSIRGSQWADDPLGSTGYFIHNFKMGSPESPVVVEEYSLDIQLLRDLRVIEQEIMGEWNSGVRALQIPSGEWQGFWLTLTKLLSPAQLQEYEALKAEAAVNRELKTTPEDRNLLLEAMMDRRNALQAMIRVRGREFADDSVARTGYYSRKVKVRGSRGRPVLVHEYSLDTQLLREIDAIEKQIGIARETPIPLQIPGEKDPNWNDLRWSLLTPREVEISRYMLSLMISSHDAGFKVMAAYVRKLLDLLGILAKADGKPDGVPG
ncbi:MAG TPA: hypothetical protein VG096_13510 [Bryobacteraceae bacterium]|jgi:hypothetical protein|nr:hypothetical protein [Bryobacteraceae bacterium]